MTATSNEYSWPASLSPLRITSSLTSTSGYRIYMSSTFSLVLVWMGFLWVSVLIALMAWGISCFAANDFPTLWPLKVLRMMSNLSSGVLFVPLLQIILQTSCSSAQGSECSAWADVIQIVLSAFATIIVMLLALLINGVYYEASIWSKDLNAQAHGRLNIIMFCLQLVLVLVVNVFTVGSYMVLIIVLAAVGFVWLVAHVYFMPFFSHFMNRLWVAGACCYLAAVVALTFNVYVRSVDAALLLYIMLPLAAGCGIAIADARANAIICAAPERLMTPYEVELRARYMLHTFVRGHPLFSAHMGSVDRAHAHSASSAHATHAAGAVVPVSEADMDAEYLQPEHAATLLDLYRKAAPRFAGNPMLHLFTSRFYGSVLGNRHMQMSHLLQADRCSPAIDVAFTVFQTRRHLENEAGSRSSGGEAVSALARVSLDKYTADARKNVQRAATRQLAFWAELNDPTPNLTRLHRLARETNEAIRATEANFLEVFSISSQALPQLRLYAAFNLHVTCNTEKATVLLGEAERIEDARSRDHRTEAGSHLDVLAESNLEVWTDSTAILTTSSNLRDLGVITSVNS